MTPPRECFVVPVAAFQLAYQGFPWQPSVGYESGSSLEGRRYPNGETYPAWHEIDDMIASLPDGTRLSFHLNESEKCPYVSSLLQGAEDALKLVDVLCNKYHARHIQININARGVPPQLFTPGADSEKSAMQIANLASQYPDTLFVMPVFRKTDADGTVVSESWPFVRTILESSAVKSDDKKPARNVVPFFDNSGGMGKTPDAVPEIPREFPREDGQMVGMTGGINASNVKDWLSKYAAKAEEHGLGCISDAQTGFREGKDRGKPIDEKALEDLMRNVY
ncbi:unnamed protein product, partial [Symbiodinium pilosum]